MKNYYNIKKLIHVDSCVGISQYQWDKYMNGAVKANGSKIRELIKTHIPTLYKALALEFYNPYESHCQRTKTHFIYVHSGIEYFLRFEL